MTPEAKASVLVAVSVLLGIWLSEGLMWLIRRKR